MGPNLSLDQLPLIERGWEKVFFNSPVVEVRLRRIQNRDLLRLLTVITETDVVLFNELDTTGGKLFKLSFFVWFLDPKDLKTC